VQSFAVRFIVDNPLVPGVLSLLLVPGFNRAHLAIQLLVVAVALGMSLLLVSALLTRRARAGQVAGGGR
jgi:hypothetical protein